LKKRILYISPNFNLACGVSKSVFTLLTSDELKKEFNLHFITNGGDALQKLDKASINYSLINFKTDKIFHFDLFRNLKWLRKYCEEKEIDIIHSHHRYPEYLSNSIKKFLGIKTVVTVHNFVTRFKHFSYKADRIIAVSCSVRNYLYKYFKISENKIDVLYNCIIDESRGEYTSYSLKNDLNIPLENKIILYTGRINEEKGINSLVDAFNMISKDFTAMELVLLGDNKLSLELISKISINAKIHLLPSREKVSDLYKISDVVILPSLNEPLGYTMLEAGLYKVPFIGSRSGGISEFIDDGVNGFLFEPGNADDLADKIRYVINNPKKAKSAAVQLHKKVKKYCNCEEYFTRLKRIYEELLES